MSTTAVHNLSKDKLKAGQKNASTAGSVYNFGVDSGLSAYVGRSSFPSAGGDQHEDLLHHRHRNNHQSYPAADSHYHSVNSGGNNANGLNPKVHNRVNSTSTDDDGDHSLSLAPEYSLNTSHQISQCSAQVNALVEKCANESVYQLLFGTSTKPPTSTAEKQKTENSTVGKSNADQVKNFATMLSGFQSFDPFALSSSSSVDSSPIVRKPKLESTINNGGTSKLGGKAMHFQRRSDGGLRQTNKDQTGTHGLLHLDLNSQSALFRDDMLSSHNMVEHRLADSEQTVDVTAPIKVVLNPRENNYEGREAAQSPRAKASPPYADSWAIKTTFSPSVSKSENVENGSGGTAVSIPPSPPMSRKHAVHAGSPTVMGNNNHEKYIELLTQHNSFKKQLFDLEENLKRNSGRVLTESELNAVPEYKAIAAQVSKVRLRLKEWKSNGEAFNGSSEAKENFTTEGIVSGSSSGTANKEKLKTMRQTIQASMSKLAEKRREANRPFDIEQMTEVEAKIEKEQTQKELLNFEKVFGRAKTAEERHIVTELYDRYRCLKKLVRQRPSRTSAPPTIESDITDINSDFGENNSLGTHYNLNIVSSGIKRHSTIGEIGPRTGATPSEHQTSPPVQTQHELALTSLKGATYAELQAERSSLLEKKRRLSKNLNSISRSANTYKQQADVNELRKVKARLKQVELFLATSVAK